MKFANNGDYEGVLDDLNLPQRFNEALRANHQRAAEIGRFTLDALSGLKEHPVVSAAIGGVALGGGIAAGVKTFGRHPRTA
jgi:hypothetical protein